MLLYAHTSPGVCDHGEPDHVENLRALGHAGGQVKRGAMNTCVLTMHEKSSVSNQKHNERFYRL